MPYPEGFLESRAVIKPGIFTVIPPEGRVINSIPGFEGCKLTIIASPKHGASFVQYVGTVESGGKTTAPFVEAPGIETFLIWFGPFTQQAVYATGREPLWYIYSKDMNRDADI